ncbi:hypothetical protein TNIN_161161 [Trichonephila inaurata madagascariensis]|uniref:Uncharacterized protein n=1 Tax=Trichonephila inaurata madagascariensis TaxID=2747483 RepID=A0A8X6YX03_9ARAC|nr:hypothetical protein TNIN_161161 [Trichonephila inaurata madagascariensis]
MQLVPVRHEVSTELYIDAIGPLPIAPIRNKHILPDMCMSSRCHEAVPEKASTPLVEALLQIFRRVFFQKRFKQMREGTLFMSISTTELFEKLGTYCPLRMPFTFKNVFYYFSRMIAELTRGYEKFDLLYLNKASIFSENWDYSINHINKALEQSTHLTIEPVKRKFVQCSVKYLGYVVGKRSQA